MDGDNVFTTFDHKNHYLLGGTGKYATLLYTVMTLHETVGGRPALIVIHKAAGRSSRSLIPRGAATNPRKKRRPAEAKGTRRY